MKIKLICFDLDGVLVDTKELHFRLLNEVLESVDPRFVISEREHLDEYDGLSTKQKLEKLNAKGLEKDLNSYIWKEKQKKTEQEISSIKNPTIRPLFVLLKQNGYKLAVCSNSIRKTLYEVLAANELENLVDLVLSNDDVTNPKPHSEIYTKAALMSGFSPKEVLVLEDSPNGRKAAFTSGAHLLPIVKTSEVTFDRIVSKIEEIESLSKEKWEDDFLNIVIPMAGAGSRFKEKGYSKPKPLVDVNGLPMIVRVIENLAIKAHYIFIIQKKQALEYNLETILKMAVPNSKIIEIDGLTEGAACTILFAKEHINNNNPVLFANSDQIVEWNSSAFMYKNYSTNADGSILCFTSTDKKWSYAKTEGTKVVEVAEKNPISNTATVGIYFWKKGSDFVRYAEQMISKNIRTNNEFYLCPVFNEAIGDGKQITVQMCEKMHGIGTPEDLEAYLGL